MTAAINVQSYPTPIMWIDEGPIIGPISDVRITEEDETRLTEEGEYRITEP